MNQAILLRSFKENDLEALFQMTSDPLVMQHTGFKKALSKRETEQKLTEWRGCNAKPYFVWYAAGPSGSFVGWGMLRETSEERYCSELGYMLLRSQWGKGLGTQLGESLVEKARAIGYQKLIARVSTGNIASIRILKKIGMHKVAYENEDEKYEMLLSAPNT